MQNDELYKKLRCLFLVLAIFSMIIALTKKVNAAEIQEFTNYINNCYDYSKAYHTEYTDNIINEIINNSVCFYEFYNDNKEHLFVFSNHEFVQGYIYNQNFNPTSFNDNFSMLIGKQLQYYYGNGSLTQFYTDSTHQVPVTNIIIYSVFTSTSEITIYKGIGVQNKYWQTLSQSPGYYITLENNRYKLNNNDGTWNNSNLNTYTFTASHFHSIGNNVIGNYYSSNFKAYTSPEIYTDDMLNGPNINTSGFSVFKYNNLGIDTLRIVPPKNKVIVGSHTSNISTVTFDLVIDGTIIPTTYNSESEFYYESIEYNRAYYEIPFNTLLPSSINDFNNVYVTNVVYNNSWENQGGETGSDTFYYVDKIYLKQTIDNEDIGQVSIAHVDTNTGYDETHITDIYNMITNASTISGEFNTEKNLVGGSSTPYSFTSFQDAIVRTVECYHPTGTKNTDWTPIVNENGIEFESGDNMYWLEYVDNTQVFNNRYNYNISPYSYIRENNYTGYYDILYFIVHEQVYSSNGTGFSTLNNSYTRYFYFISDRYYNKLILYREMDIMEYIKLNNEISEKVYNYLYDRLLNIDDNIYYYIKDKANIDNDILTALENIDNDMQFNFDIINDLLNKILNALSELHLSQLDTIETKLNTIIANIGQSNNQNEDDTVAEAIQYYKSHNTNGVPTGQVYIDDKMSIWISGKVHLWLQGTDANTDKTNLINSVFDTLTSIYDSMKDNNDIFPNIQYYLDAIAKNNNYAYETHGDYMTRLFKGNVDISTYSGIAE